MAQDRRRRRPARGHRRGGSARPAAPGPVLDLEVERIAHGGVAVARHEGRVVFVADAIPGERVAAQVVDAGRERFWRAETISVLRASPDRREHPWAEASVDRAPEQRAGGAEFGHIAMARQRELKADVLRDALRRMGGVEAEAAVEPVDPAVAPGVDPEAGTGWRTRVRLHVAPDGTVGPYAARSHTVVPVASLPLAAPAIQAIAPIARTLEGATAVDLVAPADGDPQLIVRSPGDHRSRRDAAPTITERVGERRFTVDRDGFWQVHVGAAATLTAAVQDLVDPDRFDPAADNQDLYGGVGLLAAAVGDRFGSGVRITTVEADAGATEHAGANLADWVGARAVTARVDRYLDELAAAPDAATRGLRGATVVLDPPRSGAGRAVVDRLAALRPAQVVYVACDPVALARDVGLFRAHGYELEALRAFDLFPDTHHVEAVARLAAIV
ncbi:tRNA/tmRNA/rRNA uracil-C5-methylase (TrmA/RlmC/RlmD family) [Agromyces flavus]|uniref:tRNA/tmRNA/rRNA uracil-C5-methylase (TrmA/RlmC/RlmD family) n=1 Tax=Agromyces flavus TaxID=589382 RepID=A0A1H1UM26_9MICO|nr:TRAM domain-containing protein [Agromyces flavus]MCP2368182.1 tRNA/tmRNA/rRNA uracil-C5-methylase (TrmA/RlmC/RlmD family) [Agromyces flavus]SDS73584.1 tRNA/tmRNA/rRNA uracil-C5-methylase, TrmA/RlmC/RlmD family [Agromyces flavus]